MSALFFGRWGAQFVWVDVTRLGSTWLRCCVWYVGVPVSRGKLQGIRWMPHIRAMVCVNASAYDGDVREAGRNCAVPRFVFIIAIAILGYASLSSHAQSLVGAQFRKNHAMVGDIDLPIDFNQPITGNVSVEPRVEGTGHRIVFQYDLPITSVGGATALNSVGTSVGMVSTAFSGNEVVVTLTGIADASLLTVAVTGVNGAVNSSVSVGFLVADFDSSRGVTSVDIAAAKLRSGAAVAQGNGQFDVGASGKLSAADVAAAKSRQGRSLPGPTQVMLQVLFAGTGSGAVSSTPSGIACPATACMAPFTTTAMSPQLVQLTATPNSGSLFGSWSGGCSGMMNTTSVSLIQNTDCIATFVLDTRVVTPNMPTNGTVSPSTAQTVAYNSSVVFTLSPNVGFVPAVTGTCGGTLSGNTFTTSPVTTNCTVNVAFNAQNVNVTPSAGANGTISPNTVQAVPYGTTRTFTVTPSVNYTASVGGTCGGTLSGNTYTTNPVTAACTVSATFTRLSYTVTPSASANGTISPSTAQSVLSGATRAFTVTPNSGYTAVMSGTCGGTLSGTTFTTSAITGNCSVVATFASTQPKYVATTGNDTTGNGTSANPWKTIAKGISSMVGGETLIVKNGTYTGTTNFIRNVPSGTAQLYTNIQAESPMQVRIQSNTALTVPDNQLNLTGNYIKVDGFIFEMSATINPAFTGVITGNFNTLSRSIFKRSGDIDSTGGLLSVTGSDTLIEDVAGTGACRYCFTQGGATTMTQRNVWRRVLGRFDYSNSTQTKATFATEGSATPGNVRDHLYQNVIAIDGQNPGNLGGSEKMGGFYVSSNTSNVQFQGSMVLNEGAGPAGALLSELGSNNPASNMVVWDVQNSLPSATGIVAGSGDRLTVGGMVQGAATNLLTPATNSLLKPMVNPSNLLNNTPGAVITKRLGTSGTRWGQAGYDQPTTTDLWPWPFQDIIAAVFRESNPVPPGNSPATNDTNRGFATTVGNALYGGPKNLTTYVWEYLGSPCPPTVCLSYTVTSSAGAGGMISPASTQTVLPGGQLTFTVTPNSGFIPSVGGTCGGTLAGSTYTTNAITANCTVVASFNMGQAYYVSNSGSNANTCTAAKSSATPKQTIQGALSCLAPGDTLIVRDGTYGGTANAFTNLPNGTSANYITLRAENEGNAIITAGLDMVHTNSYIIVQGFRFQDANVKTILGNHLKFYRNEFMGGCAFGNCTNTTIGTNDFNDTADILLEDNWWHGLGGRYTVLTYNANRVVIRRAVIRHDGGWTDDKDDPEAGINFYNSTNCSAQNVIVLDSNLSSYHTWQSAFYNVFNNASPNSSANNSWLGIIALNNTPAGFPDGAGLRFDGNAPQTGHTVQNAVLWDNPWGINVAYASSVSVAVNGVTIGQSTRGSNGYGIAGGSGGTKSFTNAIITNMNNTDFNVSGASITFFDTFNNGSAAGGTGKVTYNPRTNGLLALMRIETGTPLKTAGSGGGQIGAQVVNRIGAPGTLQGETGWNTDTGTALWPFPNEARIKKEMCTDAGVTRGFCSATSLTQYIGGYLGNPSPY